MCYNVKKHKKNGSEEMFFARPMEYKPCGIFSVQHFILFFLTIVGVIIAVKRTDLSNNSNIKKKIRNVTIMVWILEIIKIIFNFNIDNKKNINTYIPLYYCSILLYAGIFSSIGKGVIKRVGDVFLATGGIVGGVLFLIFPTTSITTYPIFHYISIQSFIYHGSMLYLGIIINKSNYIQIDKNDIKYYASLMLIMCVLAYMINLKYGSNLMFISKDFPGTPVGIIYNLTGKYFTLTATLIQIIMPFYAVLGIKNLVKKTIEKKSNKIYQVIN